MCPHVGPQDVNSFVGAFGSVSTLATPPNDMDHKSTFDSFPSSGTSKTAEVMSQCARDSKCGVASFHTMCTSGTAKMTQAM